MVGLKGDLRRTRKLAEEAVERAAKLGHVQTTAHAIFVRVQYDLQRRDPAAALHSSERATAFARKHGMEFYAAVRTVVRLGRAFGFRSRMPTSASSGNRSPTTSSKATRFDCLSNSGSSAECEADSQDVEAAYATIEEALVQATDTGQHYADTYLHRVRGDILLKRHPADPALAEEAYKTAIVISKSAGRAQSSVCEPACGRWARLYQTTGRPAEAHAVLAPALEGFAPTPDMPEIGEAQALLAALAETDTGPPA